jgi:hypothetical protein
MDKRGEKKREIGETGERADMSRSKSNLMYLSGPTNFHPLVLFTNRQWHYLLQFVLKTGSDTLLSLLVLFSATESCYNPTM